MRDRFSDTINGILSVAEDIGHSLLRVRWIEPGPRRYQLSQIRLVSVWQSSLMQVVSKYPGRLSSLGRISLLDGRNVGTQQRVYEICSGIERGILSGVGRDGVPLSARKRRRCGCQESCRYHHAYRPDEQSVSGITKIHFVGVNTRPFCSQTTSQISSEGESGLLGFLPEKKVRKPACRIGQDT